MAHAKPTDRLPSARLLQVEIAVGALLIASGVVVLGYHIWVDVMDPSTGYSQWDPSAGTFVYNPYTGIRWYHYMPLLAFGIVAATHGYKKFYKYFRHVCSGLVADKSTYGGGRLPLEWKLCIEGLTMAGEIRYEWISLTAGRWEQFHIGDRIKLSCSNS
ncbi:MAG TPA: hypothetical protein VLF91_04075 [Candidatus Saccharimonadales bacterium]|nr:hypothetical protein [Candidatus Saccharimonadales bacterium]